MTSRCGGLEGRRSLIVSAGIFVDPREKQKFGFPEFVWIWNGIQRLATPPLHLRIARWLANRWAAGDRELLLMAFRSSGKSTIVGLFAAWLLLQDSNTRILGNCSRGWPEGARGRENFAH